MTAQSEILMLLGMALVTFLIRFFLWGLAGRIQMHPVLERALYYVPPAVLTAIIVPSVLLPQGEWFISWQNAYLAGAIGAVIGGIVIKKHVLMASIASGMAVFYLWRFFL